MHNIRYSFYDENINKNEVEENWNEYVRRTCYREGVKGLYSHIKWLDFVCNNEEKAYEFLESRSNDSYNNLAVKFIEYPDDTYSSDKYKELIKKLKDLKSEYNKAKIIYSNLNSKNFITCPNCSFRVNKDTLLIYGTTCQMCNAELMKSSKSLENYEEDISKIQQELDDEKTNLETKALNRAKIKWLVRIEYHD